MQVKQTSNIVFFLLMRSSVCLTFLRTDRFESPPYPITSSEFVNIFPLWCQLQDLNTESSPGSVRILFFNPKKLQKFLLGERILLGI